MDKQKASEEISSLLAKARQLLDEAVSVSEKSGVVFDLPWGGEGSSESGLGGTYIPTTASEKDKEWYSNWNSYRDYGWQPSAGSC